MKKIINYLKNNKLLSDYYSKYITQKNNKTFSFSCNLIDEAYDKAIIYNKSWLESKLKIINNLKNITEVEDIFSELRAFLYLYNVFNNSLLCEKEINNKKPDFYINDKNIYNKPIIIDVASYNSSKSKKIKRILDNRVTKIKNVTLQIKVTESNPAGFPQRQGIDIYNSENISKLNNIKNKEDQFIYNCLNILWIDFFNQYHWDDISITVNKYFPFYSNNSWIYFGWLWHGFYSKKNDIIFDCLNKNLIYRREYKMEYNAKFQSNSILDFAIFNLPEGIIIFENCKRRKKFSIYEALLKIPNLKLEYSFLNWPNNNLKSRINYYRKFGKKLYDLYYPFSKKNK
ncbi:MAG: hypothetical protein KAT05_16560 [Spirochaetes bacterium]|nr:hypothetical protein [Spirochaetota bacterium]